VGQTHTHGRRFPGGRGRVGEGGGRGWQAAASSSK